MPDSTAAATVFPVNINETVTDSLKISAYTTWTYGRQHILQRETVRYVVVNPVETIANLQPGLSFTLYKTKEANYKKLDTLPFVTTGVFNFPQPFVFGPPVEAVYNWVKVNGFVKIDTEGDYLLTTGFEDSPLVFLDNVPVINRDKNCYVEPQKALLHLKKGYYALKGYYTADDVNSSQKLLQLKAADGRVLDPVTYLYHL